MNRTIGEIIKELRSSRNLTQEQLAENLNVTAQTISKWENNIGMPDISQVVPLAHFFGVTTDTLFGINADAVIDEIQQYIDEATGMDSYYKEYSLLKNALKQYPGDIRLLSELLSCGQCLLADGDSVAEPERSIIYNECEMAGKLILSYSKSPGICLETAGWLIRLYCEMGDTDKAVSLCELLPSMGSLNKEEALARVFEKENEYLKAASLYETNFSQFQQKALHSIILEANMYAHSGNNKEAIQLYNLAICLGNAVVESNVLSDKKVMMNNIAKRIELCNKMITKLS